MAETLFPEKWLFAKHGEAKSRYAGTVQFTLDRLEAHE